MPAVEAGFRQYIKNHTTPVPVEGPVEPLHVGECRQGRLWIPEGVIPNVPPLTTHVDMEIVDRIDDEMPPSMRIMEITHSLRFVREVGDVRLMLYGFELEEEGFDDPRFSLIANGGSVPLDVAEAQVLKDTIASLQRAELTDQATFLPGALAAVPVPA